MLKVNLMKTKVNTTMADSTQDFNAYDPSASGEQSELIKKIGVMVIFTLVIFAYEKFNISGLNNQLARLAKQASAKQVEIAQLKKQAGNSQEVEAEVEKLQGKISLLNKLSKKRLKELKALDYLQGFIPDGVWLNTIDYDGKNSSFIGAAVMDKDLNVFIEGLERSPYFSEVQYEESKLDRTKKGTDINFKISAKIGVAD